MLPRAAALLSVRHKGVSSLEIALAPQLSKAVGASGDPSAEINQRSHQGSLQSGNAPDTPDLEASQSLVNAFKQFLREII
jgi:hypothetical protein